MVAYFLTLSSEAHSEAWTPVLLLLFTQMEKLQVDETKAKSHKKVQFPRILQEDRLRRFAAAVYPLLCQLWCADLRPEVLMLTNCVIHYDKDSHSYMGMIKKGIFL